MPDLTVVMAPLAITVLHGLLALGVTAHVLLSRRAAGSAVAWIGLAWLAPLLGSCLYVLLGINRVRRRASNLRRIHADDAATQTPMKVGRDDHLAALDFAGYRLTQRPLVGGNSVRVLRCGEQAYPSMIAAIEASRHSVALSTYLFRDDAAGIPFIDALAAATRRGCEVRVLIDGVGGGYFRSAAYRHLRRVGVPSARFLHSPLPWRMPFLNLRSHKKILAIDGRMAFTGGVNIGAENVAALRPRRSIHDTHFRIEGPLVGQIVDAFADDWLFATGERLTGNAWHPAQETAGSVSARTVPSGPDQDLGKIEFLILEALSCARSAVRIMTPYFLPDERILTAIALASLRGVEVEIVLPEWSNHPLVDWATRSTLAPLLDVGCRVWFHSPPFDHSKLMTVDGLWCLIGSANWDARSLRLNFELDLEVYDGDLAAALDALMGARQHQRLDARTMANRSLVVRLRDSAAHLLQPYL